LDWKASRAGVEPGRTDGFPDIFTDNVGENVGKNDRVEFTRKRRWFPAAAAILEKL
jgi:hypothetical protein